MTSLIPNPNSTPAAAPAQKHRIAILGAGVIGLQTALSILETREYHVTLIAEHLPTDSDPGIEYTSPWAGAHWRSHVSGSASEEEEVRGWDAETYAAWRGILDSAVGAAGGESGEKSKEEVEKEIGLGVRESIMYWSSETEETQGNEGEGLWWRDVVWGFGVLGKDERDAARVYGEEKVVFAARYESVCINVPRYLAYLLERVTALGGEVIRARVQTDAGLEGVIGSTKSIIVGQNREGQCQNQEIYAVVLTTGLQSRIFLPRDEAEKLYPIRGQTVLVKGESPKAITHIFSSPRGELSYVIPRPGSGTTILGGCKQVGNWDEKEDIALTKRILDRAALLAPELLGQDGKFKVISVQVGRRPGRKCGPKVEIKGGRVRGVAVVHAYGHAGAGYQNSIGSARKVVRLLTGY